MKLKLRLDDLPIVLSEAIATANKILEDSTAVGQVFVHLAREFCDNEEEQAAVIEENGVGEALVQPDREVILSRVVPKRRETYTMCANCLENRIIINQLELPALEQVLDDDALEAKYFIFLLVALLHECSHLFTPLLNELTRNYHSTQEALKFETPQKVGRATFDGATDNDAGVGLEMTLFGGILFFDDEQLTVTDVTDPNADIENEDVCINYKITDEIALGLRSRVRQWCRDQDESIYSIFRTIHISQLPKSVEPQMERVVENIKRKYHNLRGRANETTIPEGLKRKLFPTNFPGDKA